LRRRNKQYTVNCSSAYPQTWSNNVHKVLSCCCNALWTVACRQVCEISKRLRNYKYYLHRWFSKEKKAVIFNRHAISFMICLFSSCYSETVRKLMCYLLNLLGGNEMKSINQSLIQ